MLSVLGITSCSKKEVFSEDDSRWMIVYPNPIIAGSPLNVSFSFISIGTETTIRIINKNGEVFFTRTGFFNSGNQTFDTDGIPPGVYILEWETNNELLGNIIRTELVLYPAP